LVRATTCPFRLFAGYEMHIANSADQALRLLADDIEPELLAVHSDIKMPGIDSLELVGEIKQRFPELPVMATAEGDDECRRRASDLDASELIAKQSILISSRSSCGDCQTLAD